MVPLIRNPVKLIRNLQVDRLKVELKMNVVAVLRRGKAD